MSYCSHQTIPLSKTYKQKQQNKTYFQNVIKKYLVKDTNKTTITAGGKFVVMLLNIDNAQQYTYCASCM